MVSIVVIGPGAVGGTVAAHLARVQPEVSVAARTPFDVLEVESDAGVLRESPTVLTDPIGARAVDWVLVATKAYDADAVEPWLSRLTSATTTVAILQNGVEHVDRFAPFVPREQLLPVVVDIPADRSAPGRIVQHGAADLIVADTERGRAFVDLFAGTGIHAYTVESLPTAMWRKLMVNAPGAINAVTLQPRLDLSRPDVERLVRSTMQEVVEVGRAEGAQLSENDAEAIVAALARSSGGHLNSLHADRLAGRPMEIDARNGAVVRFGRKHGIATPVNEALVGLLAAVDARSAT
jgi:2-dehydropantoate 2-reductase